ncbi:MAG: hypothetical protein KY476_21530 [Planctomycetes bacterium]|nr:hypothetical protein [Planctomycetota bacterium]
MHDAEPGPPTRLILLLIGLACLWWAFLAVLAVTTANPVTLNRAQFQEATHVVTATVEDPAAGLIAVEREWKTAATLAQINVLNLSSTAAERGERYVLPLQRLGRTTYRVPPAPLPGNPPLIYPATDEALRQLKELLGERAGR